MPAVFRSVLAGVVVLTAATAARAADPIELTRRQKGDLAIRARAVLTRYCAECHTGAAAPGQSLLPLLNHPQVVTKAAPVPFVTPGDPDRSLILQLVRDGSMPPGGRSRPGGEEIAVLREWVQAGAPSYPRAFDDRATLGVILDDLDRQKPDDVRFLRYVSLAHLVPDDKTAGAKAGGVGAAELRLSQALMLVSSGKLAGAEPVDDTATLFRLDLRRLGWEARDLFRVDVPGDGKEVPNPTPFDLVLLEYPFGFTTPGDDPDAPRLNRFLDAAGQVRPVPFVRGDWLAAALVQGTEKSPLAEDLLALDALARWQKTKKSAGRPDGPAAQPFPKSEPLAVPFPGRRDWQTPVSPFAAWYARDVVPTPAPFALKAEVVGMSGKVVDSVKTNEPFMLRVSADRDVYVTLLYVMADGATRFQPMAAGPGGSATVKANTPLMLRPPGANAFQIASVLPGKESAEEFFVLLASPKPLPTPTVVASKHATPEIWRFLPDQGKGFDPAQTVRTVVPITVVAPKK